MTGGFKKFFVYVCMYIWYMKFILYTCVLAVCVPIYGGQRMSSVFITESGDKLAAIFLPLSSTALGLQASVRLHSALFIGSVVQTQALTLIQQELCPMSHLSSSGFFF